MFGLSQDLEGSKYFISGYKTREAERTMTFRFQGKGSFGFIAASEIPLVLEDFGSQSLTLLTNYLGESHHSGTSAYFSSI